MTIRDAINEMLAGLELGTDPAEVLAEHGFEDLSPDAVSSAMVHFAEQAPLATADALAPIVTRVSPVPFEDGDLAPAPEADAILDSGGDVFSLLSEVGLDTADPSTGLDAVETAVDEVPDTDAALEEAQELVDDGVDAAAETFGVGDDNGVEVPGLDEEVEDLLDTDAGELVDAAEDAVDGGFDALDTQSFTDLFDREAAGIDELEDTDPSDLDLE